MSLDDDSGIGGHLKTRLGPFADELTSKSARRVSAIYCESVTVERITDQTPCR